MSNRNYVYPAKTLSQSRSKFKMPHTLKTSFLHGKYNLFKVYEVLPGDTFKLNIASLIRMSTPIAPIMDNITMHLAAYFVPNRLVYDNWEQLMGANKTGAWTADTNSYVIPTYQYNGSAGPHTLWSMVGLPDPSNTAISVAVNALPFRAYCLVWSEYYRNQSVTEPISVDHSSNNAVIVPNTSLGYSGFNTYSAIFEDILPLGKYSDIFTKCLPEPQKHDPIAIIPNDLSLGFYAAADETMSNVTFPRYGSSGVSIVKDEFYAYVNSNTTDNPDAVALTANQAWNNINALRFAFQLQKFYEKDARYGTRYFEMLNGHFGVTNPDLVLNRPQFLGELNFRINIDQVLSTAGYSASSSTTVGAPGANSVTGNKGSLFTGSFTEHGYIIIVGGTRHDHTYSDFIDSLWTRSDRLDFYDPVFANIGEQPIYTKNIDAYHAGSSTEVFGYQEAWSEYRFIPDMVTGILNPNATGSLDFWTLADQFSSKPVLNNSFIYENRNSLSRCLVTGSTGPDYIADFYFDLTVTREMPLFSIPGLADHH